jgi:hypothetical protein
MRRLLVSTFAAGVVGVAVLGACGPQFEPQHKVQQMRILAVQADKPYAKPGETVTLEMLAYDGRSAQPEPMQLFWFPFVCVNPPNDLYYTCFIPLNGTDAGAGRSGGLDAAVGADAAGDAGARGGNAADLIGRFPPGTDLTPYLAKGPKFSFKMPDNAIDAHPPIQGTTIPYGLAIVFNMACAGRVVLTEIDPAKGPQQVPVACVDKNGDAVPPESYVFGFTRVYAYKDEKNTNPVMTDVKFDGVVVDEKNGIRVQKCTAAKTRECEEHKLDSAVTPESWEESRIGVRPGEPPRHEQIWASYYMTTGDVSDGARLLYDADQGRIEGTETKFQSPAAPTEGIVWVVIRDNRGGTTWRQFPLHVTDDVPAPLDGGTKD